MQNSLLEQAALTERKNIESPQTQRAWDLLSTNLDEFAVLDNWINLLEGKQAISGYNTTGIEMEYDSYGHPLDQIEVYFVQETQRCSRTELIKHLKALRDKLDL